MNRDVAKGAAGSLLICAVLFYLGLHFWAIPALDARTQGMMVDLQTTQSKLNACEDQFAEYTVLYEPAPRSVSVLHGALSIAPGPAVDALLSGQGNLSPKWLIPARVVPRGMGDTSAMLYRYIPGECPAGHVCKMESDEFHGVQMANPSGWDTRVEMEP